MQSWSDTALPSVPGQGPPLRLYDTADRQVRPVTPGEKATMYVCGITPYDATHLGHAATYLTFDLVNRIWRDAGHDVHYVQNVTDVETRCSSEPIATARTGSSSACVRRHSSARTWKRCVCFRRRTTSAPSNR